MTKQQFPHFEPIKIDEKFWAIEQSGVRCYLFEGDDMALLVDAGFGGDLKSVCEKLTDKPSSKRYTQPRRWSSPGYRFDAVSVHISK